jgi:hypothetical protein
MLWTLFVHAVRAEWQVLVGFLRYSRLPRSEKQERVRAYCHYFRPRVREEIRANRTLAVGMKPPDPVLRRTIFELFRKPYRDVYLFGLDGRERPRRTIL